MVCHLFLKKNPFAVRDPPGEVGHYFSPIGFARCDHFVCARMFYARHLKVIGVKRLIDNDSVAPITPRPHHGRRDISRTRPHGEADGLNHPQRFSRYQRLDQRKWTPLVLARSREQQRANSSRKRQSVVGGMASSNENR
jgi:hypothetical protein